MRILWKTETTYPKTEEDMFCKCVFVLTLYNTNMIITFGTAFVTVVC